MFDLIFYSGSFISPNAITPFLRSNSDDKRLIAAGIINIQSAIEIAVFTPGIPAAALASIVPKTPTSPLVPIPPPEALHFSPNNLVDKGPTIAEAIISGTIIIGFFIRLGI